MHSGCRCVYWTAKLVLRAVPRRGDAVHTHPPICVDSELLQHFLQGCCCQMCIILLCFVFGQIQGHHIKAQILSGLGRSKEVLKEFIYCLALNPECSSAKKETQKVWALVKDFLLQALHVALGQARSLPCLSEQHMISNARDGVSHSTVITCTTFDNF